MKLNKWKHYRKGYWIVVQINDDGKSFRGRFTSKRRDLYSGRKPPLYGFCEKATTTDNHLWERSAILWVDGHKSKSDVIRRLKKEIDEFIHYNNRRILEIMSLLPKWNRGNLSPYDDDLLRKYQAQHGLLPKHIQELLPDSLKHTIKELQ